jgi:NNP family nitrate/nitrite transporter-like MFS transporter
MNSQTERIENKGLKENEPKSFRSQLGPILFLAAIFFLNFMARIVLAPLMPAIEADLGVDHAEAGSFFLFLSVGYFVSVLFSGLLSSRMTHRKVITISAMAVGASLLTISLCNGLWALRTALFLLGMSAGIYIPSGIATLTSLVQPRHWGKALAIHELAPNVSFIVAPLLSETLMLWFSWQSVLVLLGCVSLGVGAAFSRFGRGGNFQGEPLSFGVSRTLFSLPDFWIMIVLVSLGISGTLGIYTMLPLYLVTGHGMDRHRANTMLALSRTPGVAMAFVSGWVTDRFGPKPTLCSVFVLTGLLTVLLGMVSDSWVMVIIFLQGICASSFFPPGLTALSSIAPPRSRNVAVSLTLPVASMLGGGVIPMAIGLMGDAGFFSMGIILVGLMIFSGSILSICLKASPENT